MVCSQSALTMPITNHQSKNLTHRPLAHIFKRVPTVNPYLSPFQPFIIKKFNQLTSTLPIYAHLHSHFIIRSDTTLKMVVYCHK